MYTDFYGFSEQPFQLTPDARFYFDSRTHKKAMAYLGYGLAQGEGFIVITGEIGAGKSTLAAHLMATIDRARLNAVSLVSTQVEGDDMLRLAAQKLGIATAGVAKARLLDLVEGRLAEEARSGKRTLLIVDEAQNLPHSALEELRMLSNFQLGGRALLQIFLLGQPEFRDDLAHSDRLEQLRQRVIATHHLEAMEAGEIEAYITHRLRIVGWEGRPRLEPGTFEALHRHTGGIPRRVNQLATRLFLHAALDGLEEIGPDVVDLVVADMVSDTPPPRRAEAPARPQPAEPMASPFREPATDAALARRVALLEERLEEQERAIRRVLTLLVDWVENGDAPPRYHAGLA